jgi:ribonuclease HII
MRRGFTRAFEITAARPADPRGARTRAARVSIVWTDCTAEPSTSLTWPGGSVPRLPVTAAPPDRSGAPVTVQPAVSDPAAEHVEPAAADQAPEAAEIVSPSRARRAALRRRRNTRYTGRRLFKFDRGLGVRWIAGADEAGRGCLAGPLVAAAVLFDVEALGVREVRALTALNDSKQHDPEARDALYPVVMRTAVKVNVISRCVRGIDSHGLHNTNLAALRDALAGVARPGCLCLVDGFAVPDFGHEQRPIVDGDATSAAIAAASIVAKVTRDRFMHRADALHPGWEFRSHVGYSTPEHRDAIQRLGVSPLHRLSFQSAAYQQLAL